MSSLVNLFTTLSKGNRSLFTVWGMTPTSSLVRIRTTKLDFSKKIFSKGKAVEVDDEVGQFLIDHADAFGEFEEAPEGTASTDGVEEPMTDATTNADAGESAEEAGGHSQETGDMPATTTPTPGTASGRPSTRGRSTR